MINFKKFVADIEEVRRDGEKIPYGRGWGMTVEFHATGRDEAEAKLNRLCQVNNGYDNANLLWFNLEEIEEE